MPQATHALYIILRLDDNEAIRMLCNRTVIYQTMLYAM